MSKINISKIVVQHMKTLRVYGTEKSSRLDLLLFFGAPLVFAIIIVSFGMRVNDASVGILLSAFAILTGFLFNLLVFLYSLIPRGEDAVKDEDPVKKVVLEQTFHNISYSVLLGLCLTIICGLGMIGNELIGLCVTFLTCFLGAHLFLTIIMVLKRFHSLLENEIG